MAKTKKVEEMVYHNDYGLCKVVFDKINISYVYGARIELKHNLLNLHNKSDSKSTQKFAKGTRVKDIQNNIFGKVITDFPAYVYFSVDKNTPNYYDDKSYYQYKELLELEDQQSGIDTSYATILPGHTVFNTKTNQLGTVTFDSLFIEEIRNRDNVYAFLDKQSSNVLSLDEALKIKNIDTSKFPIGSRIISAHKNYQVISGEIISNEIKNMPNYVLIKSNRKKIDPYQIVHILEIKLK